MAFSNPCASTPGPQGFRILLSDSLGTKRTVEFSTEDEAVEFLKETHGTDAPLSFKYLDGMPVDGKGIDRILKRAFEG